MTLLLLALLWTRPIVYEAPPPEIITAEVTMYNSEPEQTDETPFITASGTKVSSLTAACPLKYEFGTRIKVKEKFYICEDRMHERYREGNYFDLWMESKQDALNFGRRKLLVEIY